MGQLTLVVTSKVAVRDGASTVGERQIAHRSPTSDIEPALARSSADSLVRLNLGGFTELLVGDRGAIWRAHNAAAIVEFDALFKLLKVRPGREMRVVCEIVQ